MNAVSAAMLERRSIRSYQERQIAPEELRQILEAALYAPRARIRRTLAFSSSKSRRRWRRSTGLFSGSAMKSAILRARTHGYHFILGAPALISAVAPRRVENSMAECAAAAENMLLPASAPELADCWSNQPHWLAGVPEVRVFFEAQGLRDEEDIFASVSIGCPAAKIPPPRKEGRVVCGL